jgi:hypothetical protein
MLNSVFGCFFQLLSVIRSIDFRISCTLVHGMYKRKVHAPEDSPVPNHLVDTHSFRWYIAADAMSVRTRSRYRD